MVPIYGSSVTLYGNSCCSHIRYRHDHIWQFLLFPDTERTPVIGGFRKHMIDDSSFKYRFKPLKDHYDYLSKPLNKDLPRKTKFL